ncbi:MAG: PAS domain S-box protein [Chitinispirillaceae bacterium]|nr:PAS domain S-box protein [Chitinispirillaceae bacterium]
MSLRFKLTLFTALFALLASIAILSISVQQTLARKNKDIERITYLSEQNPDISKVFISRIEEIKEHTTEIIRDRIVFSALLLVVFVIVIFLFSRNITGPVMKLVTLAEEITAGRKSYSERITLKSRDEIGRLADSFNTLLQHTENSFAKVKEAAEKYRELIENANSAIIRVDDKGRVLFFNEYAQRLFGYLPEEVMGSRLDGTIGREEASGKPSVFETLRKKPYVELEHRTHNGSYLWVGWTNRPIIDKEDNLPKEYLFVGSDITDKKKAEKYAELEQKKLLQADKMMTLGILASGIAHEINNPNNFIILNSQNLGELWNDMKPVLDSHAEERRDFTLAGIPYNEIRQDIPVLTQGIVDGARRIKYIVDSLKDFARQDSGDFREKVEICKVVEAAQLITGNLIKKTTSRFSFDVKGELPPVRGNFQRLEQVIINLLTNACQATDKPEKPITVAAEYLSESHLIAVSVSDQGQGISPEHLKNIFNPFYTTKRETGGTGLGLAIAFSIIKDHGGELKIESDRNNGTTATMLLPVD